ncbi:phosphatase PAP2 family protein [Rhizobium sp. S152]|uniref:phosphatase PAP2 family protein n=1 Tax=Rhizobium sp. S152 TaxID=3055038 RepID=UPI0025A9E8EA|nr:phosphatase PAP2 family protein [Rhizobium sp. S152]MDM9628771.1 phosphatase PAP2 family protein [Rhizobium sp. S152]
MRMRDDLCLYIAVAGYACVGLAILTFADHTEMLSYGQYFGQWTYLFLVFMPAIAILVDWIHVMVRFDRKRSRAMRSVFSAQRLSYLFSGMALLMALMFFQGTFTSIKNALPLLRGGFLYDATLADLDALLCFGVDPWRPLFSFMRSEIIFTIVDWNYSGAWFLVCFGTLFFVVTSPRAAAVRVRYVAMFMLVWAVCGNVLAAAFISAGPAFYGAVTGDVARFAEQLSFITSGDGEHNIAMFQHYLWTLHEEGRSGFGSGISAFPSVHVALVTMNAFFAAEISKRLGIIAFAYVAIILVSSVYLGWHYAIDGYVSVVVVGLCHFGLKWLMSEERRRVPLDPGDGAPARA